MDTKITLSKKDLKLNQRAYIIESMLEYFIAILTSGAYLAKLTTTIGISDAMTAVLASVASLAATFQIFSILLAHKTPVKRWVFPMTVIPQTLVATLYLIPFLNVGAAAPILFFAITLINQAAHNIVAPPKSDWFISPIEPKEIGSFQAKNSIVSIIGGMIFTFITGFTIDKYEEEGKIDALFIILTIVIFVIAIMQMFCLLFAKSVDTKVEKKESPFKSVGTILKNKAFIHLIVINCIWSVANGITTPFLSTYQIKELGFSMGFISTVTVVLSFANILIVYFFGELSKKRSYRSIFMASYVFGLIGFGIIAFTTPSNGQVMFTIYRVINLLFGGALGVTTTALTFSLVEEGERTSALAFKSVVTGIFGFVMTLVATPIFTAIQSADITLLGTKVFAQQILAAASFVVTLVLLIYYRIFCKKLWSE